MPQIFDNIQSFLLPHVRQALGVSHKADFCVGYFNLRGWSAVADIIENWQGNDDNRCRLLVGMQRLPAEEFRASRRLIQSDAVMDNATALRLKKSLAAELREQLVTGLPTSSDRANLLQLVEHLKSGKLIVKGHLRHPLHAKLYLCSRHDAINPRIGFLGSSNFTQSGLKGQGELNVDVLDGDACEKLSGWFEDRWDDRWSLDISAELVEIIESSWVHPVHPYHIYLKMAYHLSREARAGQVEFQIPTEFGAQLFDFQSAAVKIAAHHVNARGGVVLGDVVGLGKTIMACAVASIFQHAPYFLETLVLCPPNLKTMWEEALHRHRIIGRVLGLSEAHKLANERRYRLLIIDESHNLRAGEGSRYAQIADYIERNEPKVLLLSATPYNKHYSDLFHQLKLFIAPDKSLGIRPERLLEEVTLTEFVARHQAAPDTLAAFSHSPHADDWRDLMRLYLVRRTRSFIKTNYAHDDGDGRKYLRLTNGTPFYFPQRIAKTVPFPMNAADNSDQYALLYSAKVVDAINALSLPRYGLANYLVEIFPTQLSEKEAQIVQNLSRAGKRLMGFCRTNLFKRLESSGAAFLQSIERHIERNEVFLYALQQNLPLPIGTQDAALLDAAVNDEDDNANPRTSEQKIYEYLQGSQASKFQWLRADVFAPALQTALAADNETLRAVLKLTGDWKSEADRKLAQLQQLITSTHATDKVLIFSQFADTVRYLERELQKRGVTQLKGVTGSDANPTESAHRFSPRSNGIEGAVDELRVLIATDVLSEGQNLQDAHIIINYDLPWAIIRLIQRAGRVDRIGQNAPEIRCYSFLPAEGVEKLIDLRGRLKNRLHENAEVIGADERFFEDEAAHELRDLYHEKAGILDEGHEDGEVDLASHAFQIWKNASDADPNLRKIIPALPDVVEGARYTHEMHGSVVYVRTPGENDALVWLSPEGDILTQSQWQILRAAACDASTQSAPLAENHHELVACGVKAALDMEKNLGGGLGKPSGARYKAWHILKRYHEAVKGTLFETPQLQAVADALHKSPLKAGAVDAVNAQLKIKASDEHIVQLLILLMEENRLVQSDDDESAAAEPRLICSLGLV